MACVVYKSAPTRCMLANPVLGHVVQVRLTENPPYTSILSCSLFFLYSLPSSLR